MSYAVEFGNDGVFGRGWNPPELDGRWSNARFAECTLPAAGHATPWVNMLLLFPVPMPRPQIVRIWCGLECLADRLIGEGERDMRLAFQLPAASNSSQSFGLRLYLSHVVSAETSLAVLGDGRPLGMKLAELLVADTPFPTVSGTKLPVSVLADATGSGLTAQPAKDWAGRRGRWLVRRLYRYWQAWLLAQ